MSKAPFPENLRPEMRPVPIAEMPGVSAFFGFSAAAQACEAAGIPVGANLLAALLRGEPRAIEEATPRGLINPDGSRWQGGPDAVPLPVLELGKILADALHRRLFGTALDMGDAT
jgi:hypothetical protein